MGWIACFGDNATPEVREPALLSYKSKCQVTLPVDGSDDFKITFKILPIKNDGEGAILGVAWSGSSILFRTGNNSYTYYCGNNSTLSMSGGIDEIELTKSYFKVNGSSANVSGISPSGAIKMFSLSGGEQSIIAIGETCIYKDDVLTSRLVPTIVNDVAGFYDEIGETFYPSETATDFQLIYFS